MKIDKPQLLKEMADQFTEICFIFNIPDKRFEYINSAFEQITKRKSEDLLKNPEKLFDAIHKEDLIYVKDSFRQLLKNKYNSLLNFRICQPDNTERWIRLKVTPIIKDGKITYLSGLAEDDTARKISIFNMQQVSGWKNANLEILSHDLRGPLSIVQILTSIINKKIPDHPELHKLTQMITDISKRNIELIQTLLKKEFLSTAAIEISKERLDVVWEINQALDIYLKSQENIKKKFHFTHSHDQIFAEVDSMKFLQIINNLVSNAIKFTGDDGKILVHVEKLDNSFLVTVKDDGIGIPNNLQPILFQKYTKAGRTGLEGEQSVGLGMWIVKTLTEAHGGKVWFETELKKGTIFFIEISLGNLKM
ncbi:MAG: PAS domain-containing sensor histidine kinase [Pedobacter sp.]